ncbi:MAG TPA: serine hydrolase [Candidatus Lumbricidophila sp.]|nr:serine hydrolase [Candidatus Lumbricidophila sp.]
MSHALTGGEVRVPSHARGRRVRRGRHRGEPGDDKFGGTVDALAGLARSGMQVSARAVELHSGRELYAIDDHISMPTASLGKVLLLIEVADRVVRSPTTSLTRAAPESGGSPFAGAPGIWQHFQGDALSAADLAALVGSVNDAAAFNALTGWVGLAAVRVRAESLGLNKTALLDEFRARRGPDDAPQLSIASMRELCWLLGALARGEIVNHHVSALVVGWLALGSDLSLVASGFGLDPNSHAVGDHDVLLMNATGAERGVRAEAGVLQGPRATVAYSVAVTFADTDLGVRMRVLEALRRCGHELLDFVHSSPS